MNMLPVTSAIMDVMESSSYEKIRKLESIMEECPQVDLNTTHVIYGGMYARSITIPADVTLTGAIHNLDMINIMQGDITVTTDDGMKRLTGHHVFPSKAGTKRVGYAHSETIWTTVMPTNETDLDKIEQEATPEYLRLQTRALRLASERTEQLENMR